MKGSSPPRTKGKHIDEKVSTGGSRRNRAEQIKKSKTICCRTETVLETKPVNNKGKEKLIV